MKQIHPALELFRQLFEKAAKDPGPLLPTYLVPRTVFHMKCREAGIDIPKGLIAAIEWEESIGMQEFAHKLFAEFHRVRGTDFTPCEKGALEALSKTTQKPNAMKNEAYIMQMNQSGLYIVDAPPTGFKSIKNPQGATKFATAEQAWLFGTSHGIFSNPRIIKVTLCKSCRHVLFGEQEIDGHCRNNNACSQRQRHGHHLDPQYWTPAQEAQPTALWTIKLANGCFVGNLISGPGVKTFVPVTYQSDACRFVSMEAAYSTAAEYGFKDYQVVLVGPVAKAGKSYAGIRHERGGVEVWVLDGTGGHTLFDPARSLKVRNHSPTGFEFGYGGSGPSQLALALLLDVSGDPDIAETFHQQFKTEKVMTWQGNHFSITADEIRLWLATACEREAMPASQHNAFPGGRY